MGKTFLQQVVERREIEHREPITREMISAINHSEVQLMEFDNSGWRDGEPMWDDEDPEPEDDE